MVRKFDTPRDIVGLSEPVIVNCTGLGSRELFGDEELVPLKGQLTALVPQPEITYATGIGRRGQSDKNLLHMLPRSDGIILGGSSERGVWTMDPNEEERRRILEGHRQFFSAMRITEKPRPTDKLTVHKNGLSSTTISRSGIGTKTYAG